jgi:hypothetical protein
MSVNSVALQQMAAEKQPGKTAYDMEMHKKRKRVTEFLDVGKIAPLDINEHLLNVYEARDWM